MVPEVAANTGALRSLLINNFAVFVTASSALLAFQGSSYYEALLQPYGVKPGFVEITQADILVHGFWRHSGQLSNYSETMSSGQSSSWRSY